MKQFFPMGKGEVMMLVYLIVMAAISFLPVWRTMEIGGMAVFGWLMAALMITSPLLALLVFRYAERTKIEKILHKSTDIKDTKSESRSVGSESEPKA